MSAILLKRLAIGLAACSAVLAGVLPLQADSKHDYPETGTVISVDGDHGDVYEVETGGKIYQMACIAARMLQSTPPQCELSGKPIAIKDTVQFRLEQDDDEDFAYMSASGNKEEKLLILSTELKVLPPLPATANSLAGESCAVLARGKDLVESTYSVINSSPVTPAGPVLATPVTGGPPVLVTPAGTDTGGVITGMPVTGGPPVTAIPVAPVMGTSSGGTSTVTESEWVPFLRVQTASHVYKLACQSKECWLKDQAPQLGNLLSIRSKNWAAYLSWQPPGPKGEQKFAIRSVDGVN